MRSFCSRRVTFTPHAAKRLLDWTCGGGSAAPISERWLGLIDSSGVELNNLNGYSRVTALFAAAASPSGSISISAAATFGPYSSIVPTLAYGVVLFDGSASGANVLMSGTLAPRTIANNGGVVVSSLSISLT